MKEGGGFIYKINCIITNCFIVNNSAIYGGGISSSTQNAIINNNIIASNIVYWWRGLFSNSNGKFQTTALSET